jgi:hypothetical protein
MFLHAACGTELDPSGACQACRRTPAPEEIVTRPRGTAAPDGAARRDDPVAQALRAPRRLLDPVEI